MLYPFRHPPLDSTHFVAVLASDNASPLVSDDPHDDHALAELDYLVARLDRGAANQVRSRRYRRRSNTVTAGFRRHQRGGTAS